MQSAALSQLNGSAGDTHTGQRQIDARLIDIKSISRLSNIRDDIQPDSEAMHELIESVKKHGVLEPLLVCFRDSVCVLISGHRRIHAAEKASLTQVPCRVIDLPSSPMEFDILQAQENLHRSSLDPVGFGAKLLKIKGEKGWSNKELSQTFSLGTASVTRYLRAAGLSSELRSLVSQGKLALSSSLELDELPEDKRAELLPKVLNGSVTRDALSGMRKRCSKSAEESGQKRSRVVADLGSGRSITVSGEAIDFEGFISVLEELLSRARKLRPSGIALNTFISMLRDQAETN